jgi:membrane fusion protein (multidrug efflux system)
MSSAPDTEPTSPENSERTGGPTEEPSAPAKPKRRRIIWVLLGVVVVAALGYGGWWYVWSLSHEKTDDAQVDGHIHAMAAQVPGYVAVVAIVDNQEVAAGDVLVQIQEDDYLWEVRNAEALLAQAQADLQVDEHEVAILRGTTVAAINQAQAGVEEAEAQLEAARLRADSAAANLTAREAALAQAAANVKVAQADLERAMFELDRIRQLQLENTAALDEINTAETQHAAATARVTAAQEQYRLSAAQVDVARGDLETAKANTLTAEAAVAAQQALLEEARTGPDQVRRAEAQVEVSRAKVESAGAQVELAKINLGYCTIRAPARGVISKRSVETGEYLQPGVPMLAVVPLDDTWVVANFKETQLKNMRPGQPAVLEVDAYPDHPFKGVVNSIAGGTGARFSILPPENATGNYVKIVQRVPVKIVLQPGQRDPQRPLRLGMNVVVTVDTGHPGAAPQP